MFRLWFLGRRASRQAESQDGRERAGVAVHEDLAVAVQEGLEEAARPQRRPTHLANNVDLF